MSTVSIKLVRSSIEQISAACLHERERSIAGVAAQNSGATFSFWRFGDLVFTRAVRSTACNGSLDGLADSASWYLAFVKASPAVCPSALPVREGSRQVDGDGAESWQILTLYIPVLMKAYAVSQSTHYTDLNPFLDKILADFMDALFQRLPVPLQSDRDSVAAVTHSLVAAGVAWLSSRPETESPLSRQIDRARLIVRKHMSSPDFGPKELVCQLAMSRSKAYRLFSPFGGIRHFINRERLYEAHRRLCAAHEIRAIHSIGAEVGFVDRSTFSRSFRREFGYSPLEARQRILPGYAETGIRKGDDKLGSAL